MHWKAHGVLSKCCKHEGGCTLCYAIRSRNIDFDDPDKYQQLRTKCFPIDHIISSNDDSALKLTEEKCSLQPVWVQFEGYMTCDSALDICGVHTVNCVWDHRLTTSEGSQKKKELQKMKQNSWMRRKDYKQPANMHINLLSRTVLL